MASDGWNLVGATSGKLKVAGPAGRGAIEEPLPGTRVAADSTFLARGAAWDEYGRAISASGLRWYDGRRFLGTGSAITVHGLTPGHTRLRLLAVAHGRRQLLTTPLRVGPARPTFTLLRVSRLHHQRVRIDVATSIPGRLAVGLHSFAVGPNARTLRVGLPRGRRMTLRLRTFLGELPVSRSLSGQP